MSREARRFRLSVPQADQSVLAWLEAQDSVSMSLRLLIKDAIAREGYTDVVNKPIAQLPRRGRPPAAASGSGPGGSDSPDSAAKRPSDARSGQSAESSSVHSVSESSAGTDKTLDKEPRVDQSSADNASHQASIDEIMASTRR